MYCRCGLRKRTYWSLHALPHKETAEETAKTAESAEAATESATVETTDEAQFEPGGNL